MEEENNMENSNNHKFCLKWNNFQNNFMSQFEALKEDEDFVDVTLYCYGQCIKAHKIVLSACSPYLKNIFKEHPTKHPIIILDNLSFNNLEAVIEFVYTGQVYIEQDELPSFLKAAESLQIKGLSESSNSPSLVQTNLPSVEENESVVCVKREAEVDCESKKPKNKKSRRMSGYSPKENNSNEYGEIVEKDWFSNISKSDENNENTSQNIVNEVQNIEENVCNSSNAEEDYAAGDLKKRHWLDPRSCPLCNRVYSNLSNLRQHMKLIHNPTLVTCKLCFKTFKTDLYLRRHLISFHELNLSGGGSNMVSLESFKPNQNQIPEWNANVKMEPETFHEMFLPNEGYQVPQ